MAGETMTMDGKADCYNNKLEGAQGCSSCGQRVVNSGEPHVTFHDGSGYTGNVYKASEFQLQPLSYSTEGFSANRSVFPALTSGSKVTSAYTAGGQSAPYFPTTTGNTTYSPPTVYSAAAQTYLPSSVQQLSSRTTPQFPTYTSKYPTSFPATVTYDAPTTQTQSYTLPTQTQSYTLPTQSYATQTQSYTMPTQSYTLPTQNYTMPTQSYTLPTQSQSYTLPTQSYTLPTQSYTLPTQSYTLPTESYPLPKFQMTEESGFPTNYPAVGAYPAVMQAYNPNSSPFSQEELANYYQSYIASAPQEPTVDLVRAHSHTVHEAPAPAPMPVKTSPAKKMPPAKYPLRKKKGCCGC